jgi:hypothetical protein
MQTFLFALGFGLILLGIIVVVLKCLQNKLSDTAERERLAPEYFELVTMIDHNLLEYHDLPEFDAMSPKSIRAHILALKLLRINNDYVRAVSFRTENDLIEINHLLTDMQNQEEARHTAPKFKLGLSLNKITKKLGEPTRRQVRSDKTVIFYDQNRFEFNQDNHLTSYDVRGAK